MSDLKATQMNMQQYLLNNDAELILKEVVNSGDVDAATRLGVYGNAYISRLVESLGINFPFLYAHLGEDAFNELASEYVHSHPSCYRSIRWYGDNFSEFLQDKDPALAEIAALDWLMALVFDAQDAEIIAMECMATIAPEQWPVMFFSFHPSVLRNDFQYNVIECWQQQKNGEAYQLQQHEQMVAWIFWRDNYLNKFISLGEPERLAIDAALAGKDFSEICEALLECYSEEDVAIHAATMLKTWIDAGLIIGIHFKS